jgi:hypothetical protein
MAVETKAGGDVTGVLVHRSSVCYAVIQACTKENWPERLVIADQDENCLCDLGRVPHRILQSAFAALIVLFYSKNMVSVVMRMALGASF